MADYFIESSALIKRYFREAGSDRVLGICDPAAGNRVFIAAITPVEILAAITRRGRGGSFPPQDALAACSLFKSELISDYELLEFTPSVLHKAIDLAERHGLRGYDAVQLATAAEANVFAISLDLPPLILVSADRELNSVALSEGLSIEDPSAHTPIR